MAAELYKESSLPLSGKSAHSYSSQAKDPSPQPESDNKPCTGPLLES